MMEKQLSNQVCSHGTMATALSFLQGRHLEWIDEDAVGTRHMLSGDVVAVGNQQIIIKLDHTNREVMVPILELTFRAREYCIRALIMKHIAATKNKRLCQDQTPYEVYALLDPRNEETRYIGISHNAEKRYQQHLYKYDKNKHKSIWIAELQAIGLRPVLSIIEQTENKLQAVVHEEYWIHYYLQDGANLTNEGTYLGKEEVQG
jgi:predicted GIY-YIG superfamily endonuclease